MDEVYSLKPIAWLRADFKQKFGTPRQGSLAKNSRAQVDFAPDWRSRGILAGLEGFSHVWIVSYLHLSVCKTVRGKVCPPRLRGAKVGIMGSRSPHRPNNIGLTLARIVECDSESDLLVLSEVDLVEGTPILDLKPYLATADRPEEFRSGWAGDVEFVTRECEFTPEALRELEALSDDSSRLRALINEMLVQDPRPPAYLGRSDARFAVWVAGFECDFSFS